MITLRALDVKVDDADVIRMQGEFEALHCVLLPGLIDGSLHSLILPMIERGPWRDESYIGIGTEHVLFDDLALHLLHFAVNAPAFIDGVKRITGCDDIDRFDGRFYRFAPGTDHEFDWHNDVADRRLVGMSINLSPFGYEGGVFQLRDRETKTLLCEVANTVFGNAHLFRISSTLQHRVAAVRGTQPRTAFAGWFRAGEANLLTTLLSDKSLSKTELSSSQKDVAA